MGQTCFKRFIVFDIIDYEGCNGWDGVDFQSDDFHEAERYAVGLASNRGFGGHSAQVVDLLTGEIFDVEIATVDGVKGPIISLRAVPL